MEDTLIAYFDKYPKDVLIRMLIESQVVHMVKSGTKNINLEIKYMMSDQPEKAVQTYHLKVCGYCRDVNCYMTLCSVCNKDVCLNTSIDIGGSGSAHLRCALDSGHQKCSGCILRNFNGTPGQTPCSIYTQLKCSRGHPLCALCALFAGSCFVCK